MVDAGGGDGGLETRLEGAVLPLLEKAEGVMPFALAFVGYQSPETLSAMLAWARDLKAVLTNTGLEPKYNIWVELILEERQLLFMFFTIGARIVLGLIAGLIGMMFGH